MDTVKKHLLEASLLLNSFIRNEKNMMSILLAGEFMTNAIKADKKIFSCGNGGSMSDAMHFAEELTGRFRDERRPLPALAISDPSYLTCTANDFGFDHVFSRFIEAHGKEGDVLLAISTSGNSINIINAAKVAQQKNMKVIGLTGKDGGKLADLCDVEIRVPHSGYSDRIQEIHIKVIHILIDYIERKL